MSENRFESPFEWPRQNPKGYMRLGARPKKKPPKGTLEMVNVVCVSDTRTPLNLWKFCQMHPFCVFHPTNFASATIHMCFPHTTCLLSSSSKSVCTGARDPFTSYFAVQIYADMISQVTGIPANITGFSCVNQTAVVNTGRVFDLTGLVEHVERMMPNATYYDPQNFPCAFMYVFRDSSIKHIVSVVGKLVITGARNPEEIADSLVEMQPIYDMFYAPMGSPEADKYIEAAARLGKSGDIKRADLDQTDRIIEGLQTGDLSDLPLNSKMGRMLNGVFT